MKIFYHNDMDGHCSGAIAYRATGSIAKLQAVGYSTKFPYESIGRDETVIFVDFTPAEFDRVIERTKKVVWIDHHISSIEENAHLSHLDGIRDIDKAACELTWLFYHPNEPIPEIVKYLADFDMWKFEFGEATEAFQAGIRLTPTWPDNGMWDWWFNPQYGSADATIKKGMLILQYQRDYYKSLARNSFEFEWEGHSVIACNCAFTGSKVFESIYKGQDIMATLVWNGQAWIVSLYSDKEEVDVAKIAQKYGGGGHKGAAGFTVEQYPFA
jgi:oligoribonuclease NrnB/cAMP/cGMP phosphodiesterase (DHH superfamily)